MMEGNDSTQSRTSDAKEPCIEILRRCPGTNRIEFIELLIAGRNRVITTGHLIKSVHSIGHSDAIMYAVLTTARDSQSSVDHAPQTTQNTSLQL